MNNFNNCFIELECIATKNGRVVSFEPAALKILNTCKELFKSVYSISELTKTGKVKDIKLQKLLKKFNITPLKYKDKLKAIKTITKEDDFYWFCDYQDLKAYQELKDNSLLHCLFYPNLFEDYKIVTQRLRIMHDIYTFYVENKKKIVKDMIKVKSSNISKIGYDEERELLFIGFTSARLYVYYGVSKAVYSILLKEESKGSAFNKLVKEVNETYIRLE